MRPGPGCVIKRGPANLDLLTPITPEMVFHVASVSKQFTAYAVVRDQALTLDNDVRRSRETYGDIAERLNRH